MNTMHPTAFSTAPRHLAGQVIVASHNPGKVAEINTLLKPYGVEAVAASGLGLTAPEETGQTFADNARLKALAALAAVGDVPSQLPALADDSGLTVNALDGRPGIYSARWGIVQEGADPDFRHAMGRVEEALQAAGSADRRARFVCALALAWPDGKVDVFEGEVRGMLVWPPRGERGFGYDPMFVPDGHRQTFAEMTPDAKHRISHRSDAFKKLCAACLTP